MVQLAGFDLRHRPCPRCGQVMGAEMPIFEGRCGWCHIRAAGLELGALEYALRGREPVRLRQGYELASMVARLLAVYPSIVDAMDRYTPYHIATDPDLDLAGFVRREVGNSSIRHFWGVHFAWKAANWTLRSNVGGPLTGAAKIVFAAKAVDTSTWTVITPSAFRSSRRPLDVDAVLDAIDVGVL